MLSLWIRTNIKITKYISHNSHPRICFYLQENKRFSSFYPDQSTLLLEKATYYTATRVQEDESDTALLSSALQSVMTEDAVELVDNFRRGSLQDEAPGTIK